MLLIDLSSVVINSTIELFTQDRNEPMTPNTIRHIILSQILFYKKKFAKYGKPILCADSKNYWRKDVFPYYKQQRKKMRDKSIIDWNKFFEIFTEIKQEIIENFPFNLIEVNRLEADDIMAILARDTEEDVMIVSSDKDMLQLQMHYGKRIKQYSPYAKKQLTYQEKDYCLMTHIIKGDISDGIPNILSDDDTFMVEGKRQKSVYQKYLNTVKDANDPTVAIGNTLHWKRFKRNQLLIDVTYLPDLVIKWVHKSWEAEKARPKKAHMYDYFIKHNMQYLLTQIGEFA